MNNSISLDKNYSEVYIFIEETDRSGGVLIGENQGDPEGAHTHQMGNFFQANPNLDMGPCF